MPIDYDNHIYAGTAAAALKQLDGTYDAWISGLSATTATELARECGPESGPFAGRPLAAVVLHVNRELVAHGAEVVLLRDLYLRRSR